MSTVQDVMTQALRLIGVIASGETPATSETDDAFAALNEIVEGWNVGPEGLYKITTTAFVSPVAAFTLPSRPQRILSANYTISGGVMQSVAVVSAEEYGRRVFERGVTAIFPQALYCDYGYPTATVNIAPVPQTGGSLEINMLLPQLVAFGAQSDTITLPPGYVKALKYALALHLAAEYGRPVPAEVASIAEQARQALVDLNSANYLLRPVPVPQAA